MTLAAIYARFSSDSQRDESIEIQVERCAQLIERERWVQGEVYTDFAMTGTNDERPAFKRCIADGVAGAYDVLVIYKHDRFARNVEVSRKYKRMLRDAGVRIVSVREGESKDTPDGFLHEGLDELFAEYYSRNLSVMIRDGMGKNAANRKASGVRIFGYKVNTDDRFEIDEETAPAVRHVFKAYANGQSVNDLANWLNSKGYKTTRGNPWRPNGVAKILKRDSYIGVYRFNGVVDRENGMPAIIDKGLFMEVQGIMEARAKTKSRRTETDFILTGKLFHLDDGLSMSGTSGTGKSGSKYTYYRCKTQDGCGFQMAQDMVEDAVIGATKDFLAEESAVDEMAGAIMNYAESLPDNTPALEAELAETLKRRDNLVASIAEGISPKTVKGAIDEAEARLEELDMLIARERFNKEQLLDPDTVRGYVGKIIDRIDRDPDRVQRIIKGFVDKVYIDAECAIVLFDLGAGQREFTLEELQGIKRGEHHDDYGVRLCLLWWSIGTLWRTRLYHAQGRFFLVITLPT